MGDRTGIEWTDATWPERTPMVFRESNGRLRQREYVRQRSDSPGVAERRRQRAAGLSWCRGCRDWLPTGQVRSGVCRSHANEQYRRAYATDGAAIRARTHARRRDLAVIPPWWWDSTLADWGGLCAYGCGRPAEQRDHVWPVALGGQSTPGNVVPACPRCNARKRDSHPAQWIEQGMAVHPGPWADLMALAIEHGTDEWMEVV